MKLHKQDRFFEEDAKGNDFAQKLDGSHKAVTYNRWRHSLSRPKKGLTVIYNSENNVAVIALYPFVASLQVPSDQAVILAVEVVMPWDAVERATGYCLGVSQNSDMSDSMMDESSITVSHSLSELSSEAIIYY